MNKPIILLILLLPALRLNAQDFVTEKKEAGVFPVVSGGSTAAICTDTDDYFLVNKAADFLQQDIRMVTGQTPDIVHQLPNRTKALIIIGSVDRSALIRQLVAAHKLNLSNLKGKWEAFRLQTIDHPFKGVDRALVIVGSDRRGTAYGVFTLSKQMGVSPWYWWADVPVETKKNVYVKNGSYAFGSPAVKYRGIFINDEAPALSGWVHEKYGGFNHLFYEKVFELLLRLKGNYLWPAMWGSAFSNDDTLNPVMADRYGIVMGTSHQEPMMQATEYWRKEHRGAWNYQTNDSVLRAFWKQGIERMDHHESIVTIGMRGNGDLPMTEGSNISLLEKIVQDQRKIITEVTGKPASETPQDWALYKEVQDYYDKGMRVPDDVTLLYSDDNWGDIRRLPELKDTSRKGGYGIYYHFDYVGDPRNYKWLNTNLVPRVWEQLHLALSYGVNRIWIVNVGDIKPMEYPISFFLDYAWDPYRWPAEKLPEYAQQWAARQFGEQHAKEIAGFLTTYTKYNARRKPELLSPETYSLTQYREAEKVVANYNGLAGKAKQLYNRLPDNYKAAYYQLVLYPIEACANLNNLYVTAGLNHLYSSQGRAMTNLMADSVRTLFEKDSLLSRYYNKVMEGGRWDHMMDQTHIGYTYWQEPRHNHIPATKRIELPDSALMGIAVEGFGGWWPQLKMAPRLPVFDPYQQQHYYIDIFNRGKIPFEYTVKAEPWLKISSVKGKVTMQQRIWVSVDWRRAPSGVHMVPVTITGPGGMQVAVEVIIHHPLSPARSQIKGFIEDANGYVSMEAVHYTRAVNSASIRWKPIPGLGRTLSAMTPFPVTAPGQSPGGSSPRLEYRMYLFDTGKVSVEAYLSPTLNFHNTKGLRYAVSFDDDPPQIIPFNGDDHEEKVWAQWVSNNIITSLTHHYIGKPGAHLLKFWMVDPGVVLQKLVVNFGGARSSYLGPPESFFNP